MDGRLSGGRVGTGSRERLRSAGRTPLRVSSFQSTPNFVPTGPRIGAGRGRVATGATIRAAPLKTDSTTAVYVARSGRERGTGHLFQPTYTDRHGEKKKASIWWWRVSLKGVKQKPVSTGCTDEASARKWVRKRLTEMEEGDLSSLTADTLTLDKLERLITDDYIVNGYKSSRQVAYAFARFKRILGNVKARDLNTAKLKSYVAKRKGEGGAPATINNDLLFLGRAMNLAAKDGLVPRRSPGWLPMLKVDNARKGFFERPAFEAVLACIRSSPVSANDVLKRLFTVAYITGWRLHSDLLTRQWRHVDFDAGWLRLEPGEGKTGEGRMFPLAGELRTVLEAQRAYTDAVEQERGAIVPWVFHRDGKPVRCIQRAWERARVAAGVPGAWIHDFRRTAVRNMERGGVPRSAAMKLIGHRTETVYRRYAIVDESMLKEAGEKLSVLLERQKAEAAKVTAMRRNG